MLLFLRKDHQHRDGMRCADGHGCPQPSRRTPGGRGHHCQQFGPPRSADLSARLAGVQRVIYLLYAEGFARSTGKEHIRDDLTVEAIRLARLLKKLMPGSAETTGLLGLLLLHESRRAARTDDQGDPIPLADQERQCWDRSLMNEGIALAETAAAAPGAGTYAIQAAIAAVHAEAEDFDATDWVDFAPSTLPVL